MLRKRVLVAWADLNYVGKHRPSALMLVETESSET
jgi:hypothetical protein